MFIESNYAFPAWLSYDKMHFANYLFKDNPELGSVYSTKSSGRTLFAMYPSRLVPKTHSKTYVVP